MTINERVQHLRKDVIKTSQREFADSIGLKQAAISAIELSRAAVTDRNIDMICAVYNVREQWLRTGDGEIFQESDTFSLDQLARDHGCTDLELRLVKAYFDLPQDVRRVVLQQLQDAVQGTDQAADQPAGVSDLEKLYARTCVTPSSAGESASNTTADTADISGPEKSTG